MTQNNQHKIFDKPTVYPFSFTQINHRLLNYLNISCSLEMRNTYNIFKKSNVTLMRYHNMSSR